MFAWTIAIVVCIALAGGWAWRRYLDPYHFATVHSGALYRDGARSFSQFARAIRVSKARTVVRLVDERERQQETFAREADYCKERGVDLVDLPIKLGGWPTGDQLRQFLDIATDRNRQPVLVHCAQGVRRTAMMVAAYQESVLGYDASRAKDAIMTFGHSDRTVNDIRRFIEAYDPAARSVPDDLGAKPSAVGTEAD